MTAGTVLAVAGFFMFSHFKVQKMRAAAAKGVGEGLPMQDRADGEMLLRKHSGDGGGGSPQISVDVLASSGDHQGRMGSPPRKLGEEYRGARNSADQRSPGHFRGPQAVQG